MAGLTIYELKKRNNFQILLGKIRGGQEVELINEKKAEHGQNSLVIANDADLCARLQTMADAPESDPEAVLGTYIKNKCLLLETTTGLSITSGALQKTWEFGSKSSEMVYSKEARHQKNLQMLLKRTTVFGLKPITLHVKTTSKELFKFTNVFSVQIPEKINGEMGKSDFEFRDKEGTVLFRVSHKDGKRPRHFRQWSGLRDFREHFEVKQFGEDLKLFLTDKDPLATVFPNKLSVGREITDENLRRLAIFGNDEVDFLIQGECDFTRIGDFEFIMTAPLILSKKEDLSVLPDGYKPILLAKKGDLKRGAFGIKGCRGMIYTKSGRLVHNFI